MPDYNPDPDRRETHTEQRGIFTITVTADNETDDSFNHCDPADRKAWIAKIRRGTWWHFMVEVTVSVNGVDLATEYLGSCIYKNLKAFVSIKGDYYDQMVKDAIAEATPKVTPAMLQTLKSEAEQLALAAEDFALIAASKLSRSALLDAAREGQELGTCDED